MISPKKYKSITKIHYKYRPKVCQKIRHSKIHYNIDKKKQKRREGGGGEGGGLSGFYTPFLQISVPTNFSAKMCTHQICVKAQNFTACPLKSGFCLQNCVNKIVQITIFIKNACPP